MSLILTPDQETAIYEHAVRDYPGECCGVLIGEIVGSGTYASLVVPLNNRHEDGPSRRFRIETKDLLAVEKLARTQSKAVVGFYHSHPDVPAVPSTYDTEHAWEVYSYLIVEVAGGVVRSARSWKLDLSDNRFVEENVQVNRCILEVSAMAQTVINDQ